MFQTFRSSNNNNNDTIQDPEAFEYGGSSVTRDFNIVARYDR